VSFITLITLCGRNSAHMEFLAFGTQITPKLPRLQDFSSCRVLQCFAVCCSVLQCVAVCCSVLQCVAVCGNPANVEFLAFRVHITYSFECTLRILGRFELQGAPTREHTHTHLQTDTHAHTRTHIPICRVFPQENLFCRLHGPCPLCSHSL